MPHAPADCSVWLLRPRSGGSGDRAFIVYNHLFIVIKPGFCCRICVLKSVKTKQNQHQQQNNVIYFLRRYFAFMVINGIFVLCVSVSSQVKPGVLENPECDVVGESSH